MSVDLQIRRAPKASRMVGEATNSHLYYYLVYIGRGRERCLGGWDDLPW